jgi:hypothetical protein
MIQIRKIRNKGEIERIDRPRGLASFLGGCSLGAFFSFSLPPFTASSCISMGKQEFNGNHNDNNHKYIDRDMRAYRQVYADMHHIYFFEPSSRQELLLLAETSLPQSMMRMMKRLQLSWEWLSWWQVEQSQASL